MDAKNRCRVGVRSLIQISNERIDKVRPRRAGPVRARRPALIRWLAAAPQVMEGAALIPVEERIRIETLRLLIENAKLRKTLNDYSEGVLRNTLAKVDTGRRRFFWRPSQVRLVPCLRRSGIELETHPSFSQPVRVGGPVQRFFAVTPPRVPPTTRKVGGP